MGSGMAVMALSGSVPAAAVPPLAFTVLFGVLAAHGLVQLRAHLRAGSPDGEHWHYLHHVLGSLAMVYMASAMQLGQASGLAHRAGTAGHAATAPAGVPLLTGALLAYFAVYVLRTGLRLLPEVSESPAAAAGTAARPSGGGGSLPLPRPAPVPPQLASACRLAMGTGMLAMLLMM